LVHVGHATLWLPGEGEGVWCRGERASESGDAGKSRGGLAESAAARGSETQAGVAGGRGSNGDGRARCRCNCLRKEVDGAAFGGCCGGEDGGCWRK
jgi:hypothetical protein